LHFQIKTFIVFAHCIQVHINFGSSIVNLVKVWRNILTLYGNFEISDYYGCGAQTICAKERQKYTIRGGVEAYIDIKYNLDLALALLKW